MVVRDAGTSYLTQRQRFRSTSLACV